MNSFKSLALTAAVAGVCFAATAPKVNAQVTVDIGAEPGCPYGYYDYAPYACAPYGYYGPEWFAGGIFIGAGPWFHGRADFHGHVDSRFDVHRGYNGPMPQVGDRPEQRVDQIDHFRGDEMHDGRGHIGGGGGHFGGGGGHMGGGGHGGR